MILFNLLHLQARIQYLLPLLCFHDLPSVTQDTLSTWEEERDWNRSNKDKFCQMDAIGRVEVQRACVRWRGKKLDILDQRSSAKARLRPTRAWGGTGGVMETKRGTNEP